MAFKLTTLATSLALVGLAGAAFAQSADRVTITGSSIKQLRGQAALPVQVIQGDDLVNQGINTAEELISSLGSSAAHLDNAVSRNNVFGAEQDRLTGGSSSANLRGIGPTGTLVLLNGRRVSTHGTSGGAVDLNAIPMAAVDRIEILKDGASAIYGTDAIGGVINFILKNNFRGASVSADYSKPFASGGGERKRASITAGYGDLDTQRFNVMASLTVDKNEILRGIDRDFATGFQPGRNLSPDTTSAPHANIIGVAGTALSNTGSTVGATDTVRYTNLNLLAVQNNCAGLEFGVPLAPNVQLWDRFGYTNANSRYRCATDYGRQFMLAPPRDAINLVTRANFRFAGSHEGFVEYVASKTDVTAEFTPYQFSTNNAGTIAGITHYPASGPHYLDMRALVGANEFNPTLPIAYRLRMSDWGYRTIENTSKNQRLAAGVEGDIGSYTYKAGVSWGKAEAYSTLIDGYAYAARLATALATGIINPFLNPGEEQTPEAKALIESTKARGRIFGGDTSVMQVDASISGTLFKLPAGALDFAVGADLRKESYVFSGTEGFSCVAAMTSTGANAANAVMGCPGNASAPDSERDIKAVYAELVAPLASWAEVRLQVRHDEYSQIGSTTNPKVAFKLQPTSNFLIRGSAGTGFRAPTPQQLTLGTVTLALTGTFRDPVLCADIAAPIDATQCSRASLPYRTGGNPTLQPETSKQHSLGVAWEPMRGLQVSADYWKVELEDRIRNLSPAFMITNYALFADSFIRNSAGVVDYIQAGWVNAAESRTSGIDFNLNYTRKTGPGTLTWKVDATKMISHKERLIVTAPLQEFVGKWSNTTLYLPWRAVTSLEFKTPVWGATVSARFQSAYEDEDRSPYTVSPPPPREVESYTTYNLTLAYTGIKGVRLTAGIVNLLDTDPPFTHHNVDNVVGAGWDPRVADPRGRTLTLTARYTF
jgi:iron complex outermembrane receptor protein